jgi:hypothetical protein
MGHFMRNIYVIDLALSGYFSPHSLIRERFDAPKNPVSCLVKGGLLYVASAHKFEGFPVVIKDSLEWCQQDLVSIFTVVAFDNRHTSGEGPNIPRKLDVNQAISKFCMLTGLTATDKVQAWFCGAINEKKFNIHNAFYIRGDFIPTDRVKFKKAVIDGVGSRKSYGFGLVINEK